MEMISKAVVWYPDRHVVPAVISRCMDCGRTIVTESVDEPKAVNSPDGEHLHVVVRRQHLELCRCAEFVGDEPSCPVHGVREIPVIFRE